MKPFQNATAYAKQKGKSTSINLFNDHGTR